MTLAEAWEVVGLVPPVDVDELKKKKRELLGRWHPDKAQSEGAKKKYQQRFVRIQKAFELIAKEAPA
jgi:preprotein translocase subunit Sec63